MKRALAAVFVVVGLVAVAPAGATSSGAAQTGADAGSYVVRLKDGVDRAGFLAMHGIKAKYEYSAALNGFSAKLSKGEYASLQLDSNVAEVEGDGVVSGATESLSPSWGLDRLDQLGERLGDPLDGKYNYVGTGAGVTAYVIDSGIRTDHVEFEGRAVAGKKGFDAVGDGLNGEDCFGHGTHVAGTIGGKTYGVAKKAKLVSVRVLGCDNTGTISGLVAGVDWVVAHAAKPAVVNISIEAPRNQAGDFLSDVITNAINQNGLPFVVAAGNGSRDACTVTPAATPLAITVGASDQTDNVAAFSNYGSCVDLWDPGVDIISADNASATATLTRSGTSMATPHVAGLAALFLQRVPNAAPWLVHDALVGTSMGLSGTPEQPSQGLLAIKLTGKLAGPGSPVSHQPGAYAYYGPAGTTRIYMTGEGGTNFDLSAICVLPFPSPVPLITNTATTKSSNEDLQFRLETDNNQCRAEVNSVKGGGTYELWWARPQQLP